MTTLHLLQHLLLFMVLAGIAYYLVCMAAAALFFSAPRYKTEGPYPPVSFLVPLCGQDCEALENFSSFCRQDYPCLQIVFGVRDSSDPVIPMVQQLIARFPHTDIDLVIHSGKIGENLKISNLQNMLARAKHEHIVMVDSDIRVGSDYLRNVLAPLANEQVGVVTCLYRSAKALNWPSRLEAVGISGEFMPGVLVSRLVEGMQYALGATMATTGQRLQSIGGFQAIADYLADDFMLGHLLSKVGRRVHLSSYVVETLPAPLSFLRMMKHQIRLSRGIRACRPLGHFGLILTFGTALSFLYMLASGGSWLSLGLLAVSLALRLAMGWAIGVHWLQDKTLRAYFWLLPARDFLSLVIWALSLFGSKVEWRGELFRLAKGGKIVHCG